MQAGRAKPWPILRQLAHPLPAFVVRYPVISMQITTVARSSYDSGSRSASDNMLLKIMGLLFRVGRQPHAAVF